MMNWNALYDRLRAGIPALELRRDEPMARHTTFQVGGPVPVMALPKDEGEAQTVLHIAAMEFGIRPFFMGKGSNLLVSDAGADLLVVKAYDGLGRLELLPGGEWPGYQTILAGSGVSLARLSNFALEHGLTGLEFAHGIPGSVGGGVYMNAGAYGGELCQVVAAVQAWLPGQGVRRLEAGELDFRYRHSVFMDNGGVVLSAWLALAPGDGAAIRERMEELGRRRREKQPLELPSGGSTFKRPAEGYAAALIEQCGLKGLSVGGAQVSAKHAGFVVNTGGATCADVRELVGLVQRRVLEETGVRLETEIEIV